MSTTVADVMTLNPVMVQDDAPLNEAIRLLAEHRVSGLPVTNADGALIGIISESDLMWQETGATPPPYIMVLDSVIYLQIQVAMSANSTKLWGKLLERL